MESFEDLRGKTLTEITGAVGDEAMAFTTVDGEKYLLRHEQDCCEECNIADIVGDLQDLIGAPLLMAEEVTSQQENPPGVVIPEEQDSFTWTFYKLATIKGYVTISWYGESNGSYYESVSFRSVG